MTGSVSQTYLMLLFGVSQGNDEINSILETLSSGVWFIRFARFKSRPDG